MAQDTSYNRKKLISFPVLFVFFALVAIPLFGGAVYFLDNYLEAQSNVSWALENKRPEEITEDDYRQKERERILQEREMYQPGERLQFLLPPTITPEERRREIKEWDVIHTDIGAARNKAIYPMFKAVAFGIAGLVTAVFSCLCLYKTFRFSIPAAIRSAISPIRRIGLLLIPCGSLLLLCGIVSGYSDGYTWGELFDREYFHGIVSLSGVAILLAGIILFLGIAERLAQWVKTGS
jgi:hypothetical protein